MAEFDPETVPIRPAATVMLIDDRPDLQVYMLQRHANTVFAGGMWVFPGGAVDHQDDASYYKDIATHRTDAEASELMALPDGGLAYYMAAIRETFEEAGILLALHAEVESPLVISPEDTPRFNNYRDMLNAGEIELKTILENENLLADVSQMHYVARWITPLGSPRRFDARFFIARIPSNQIPQHDDSELVNSAWLTPREILERIAQEEMVLMTVTERMIRSLALFESASQVIEAAAKNLPDQRARVDSKTG
ncbi:MAG: NUDIX hydrolase, partial [Dehalococcoidia bacterium]|nr:NUDIX hydrolase [Dehalococcoidia bacterium]